MKLKKTLALILSASLLGACGASQPAEVPAEDNETAAQSVNIAEFYEELAEENHFENTEKDTLASILSHGTAIVFLGFPECPWCQAYIPMLEKVLDENNAVCEYYNIYTDKKADREYYDSIAALLDSQNDTGEDIIHYDNDGRQVIYMPLVLFIDGGRIIGFDNETCMEDSSVISPEDYWDDAKIQALETKLDTYVKQIAEKQNQNNSKGCDTGCKVGD